MNSNTNSYLVKKALGQWGQMALYMGAPYLFEGIKDWWTSRNQPKQVPQQAQQMPQMQPQLSAPEQARTRFAAGRSGYSAVPRGGGYGSISSIRDIPGGGLTREPARNVRHTLDLASRNMAQGIEAQRLHKLLMSGY